jgi:centromeric protein E
LTKILRSSLGGNSRTAIVLCINPSLSQCDQTLSTLRFGVNAKKIENNIQANVIKEVNDEALKTLLREYEEKLILMEKEKRRDAYHSNNLMLVIQ